MNARKRLALIGLLICVGVSAVRAQTPAGDPPDESGVRAALARFKQGIDAGDKTLGAKLVTGFFGPQLIGLYDGLVKAYAEYRAPMPMEVGHIKIRRDGRAKAEVRINPNRDLIVFTLVREDGTWKLSHMEGILIPMFEPPQTPTDEIPTIQEKTRGFMMAERDLAFKSRVYRTIAAEKGETAAREFFLDGVGSRAAMEAWFPFLEGAVQFAVYLAVLESGYYGSPCRILRATEEDAEVLFHPLRDLEVLKVAVFNPKLSDKEYRALMLAVMRNRAETCGLQADVFIEDTDCRVVIRRK